MAVDGPIREETATPSGSTQVGYLAGSKALDSLDKLITSTESFFHPSNYGTWAVIVSDTESKFTSKPLTIFLLQLTNFLQRLCAEFGQRWMEEEAPDCKTPVVGAQYIDFFPLITNCADPQAHSVYSQGLRDVFAYACLALDVFQGSHIHGLCTGFSSFHGTP